MNPQPQPRARGLDRVEIVLFLFGIFAFAFVMLAFGAPLAGDVYLPAVGAWLVVGLGFVWWFDRRLRHAEYKKLKKLNRRRAHR